MQSKGTPVRYRIGKEEYTKPTDPERPYHFHVACRWKKLNTKKTADVTMDDELDEAGKPVYNGKTTSPFDFNTAAGRVVHPNIQTYNPKKASRSGNEMLSERTAQKVHKRRRRTSSSTSMVKVSKTRAASFAAVRDAPTAAAGLEILWAELTEHAKKGSTIWPTSARARVGTMRRHTTWLATIRKREKSKIAYRTVIFYEKVLVCYRNTHASLLQFHLEEGHLQRGRVTGLINNP